MREKSKISFRQSSNACRFGDSKLVTAIKNCDIPAVIANTKVKINTDVVSSDIPLLLSRLSMKQANMTIDFENDTAFIFGQKANLDYIVTMSGHYALPISPCTQLLNNLATNERINITLTTQSEKSKFQIAAKLHRQFSHPPPEKLVKLLNSAGEHWRNDEDLKEAIKQVSSDCKTYQLYQKPPACPIIIPLQCFTNADWLKKSQHTQCWTLFCCS